MADKENRILCDERGAPFLRCFMCTIGDTARLTTFLFPTLRVCRFISGGAEWEIGGELFRVGEGDIVILKNSAPRSFRSIVPPGPVRFRIFEFTPGALGGANGCLAAFFSDCGCVLRPPENSGAAASLDELWEESAGDKPLRGELTRALLVCALVKINRQLGADYGSPKATETAAEMYSSAAYISNNFASRLSVPMLAAESGMSRGYYQAMFRKYIGIPPSAYIRRCRVENAVRLLGDSGATVLDAAYRSGFENASSFYKAFKDLTGCSPRKM